MFIVITYGVGISANPSIAQEPSSNDQERPQSFPIQADSAEVYVDGNAGSVFGSGSRTNPVRFLTQGRDKVSPNGTIYLAPATYTEALTINKPMTLRNSGSGVVVIGANIANAPDLIADHLEVTQGIQDLNNSVRLVARKRTYVRFHIHSSALVSQVNAQLRVQGNGKTIVLNQLKRIDIRPTPDRATRDDAFLFELPSDMTRGMVSLMATILPTADSNLNNNAASATVTFETVPSIALVVYQAKYSLNNTSYQPAASHVNQLITWLQRAYPVSSDGVTVHRRDLDLGAGKKTCDDVNAELAEIRSLNLWPRPGLFNPNQDIFPEKTHYYAMVLEDGGYFMRGCSAGIPGFVASGPTGTKDWGWDNDGSYGDWYGGHEIGHTYSRRHPGFCGTQTDDTDEEHPDGKISPSASGNDAIFGFDIDTHAIFPADQWYDVMTYCDNQWISDITYEGLMDAFQAQDVQVAGLPAAELMDRLLAIGVIDPISNTVQLEPMQVLSQAADIEPRVPGDYAIVLRGNNNQELARYPFTPEQSHGGPALQTTDPSPFGENESLYITELVPYVVGTVKVEIAGPDSTVLTTVSAGSNNPVVALVSPNGGETLADTDVIVRWAASDADGDPLFFTVQYSPDGGTNWETVAQTTGETQVEVARNNLLSSQQGRFRVLATDGIHTSRDESDGSFTVPNRVPTVAIIAPKTAITITVYDILALEGNAEDPDGGSMTGNRLTWLSSKDGILGTGLSLSVVGLSLGNHIITLQTSDGAGGSANDSVQVTVTGDGSNPQAPVLQVSPRNLLFMATQGGGNPSNQTFTINNGGAGTLLWTANESTTWLSVSQPSGTDQATLTAVVDINGLTAGTYSGEIQVSGESESTVVAVTLVVASTTPTPTISAHIFLPLVVR